MNDNLEIKKTDWNLYRKELNIYVDEKISFIQKFLEKEFFIKEDKEFYYKIFFLQFSRYFFNRKFPSYDHKKERKKRFNFLKYLKFLDYLTIDNFEDNKMKFSKNVSINFFHRHNKFKELNSNIISEVSSKNFKKKFSLRSLLVNIHLTYFSELKKNKIFFLKRRLVILIINYKFLKKNSTKVKNILITTHGVMSNADQVLLGCLSHKAKIISMQSGYPHFMYKYHDQDDYIEKISNKILCWGKNIKKNSKYEVFGSFYSNTNKLDNKKKSVIILPAVLFGNTRNPVSSYASHNLFEFTRSIIKEIVEEIKRINAKDKSCILQCKDTDFEYYKKQFVKYKIKNKLSFTEINSGKFGNSYLKTYVLYFSTAIIENFYAKSNVKICINSAWIDLQKKYEKRLNNINNKKFLKKNDKFIQDYCKIITPINAKKRLIKVLDQ